MKTIARLCAITLHADEMRTRLCRACVHVRAQARSQYYPTIRYALHSIRFPLFLSFSKNNKNTLDTQECSDRGMHWRNNWGRTTSVTCDFVREKACKWILLLTISLLAYLSFNAFFSICELFNSKENVRFQFHFHYENGHIFVITKK